LTSDAEALGILDQDRNKMFVEAIDVILEIWKREAPYDIALPGNRWKVSTANTQALNLGVGYLTKPYQQPRPEIVGTVLAPFSQGVIAMGQRDFHPLSANFLLSKWLPSHWDNYAKGKALAGQTAERKDWRVARTIFVADDDNTAAAYGRHDENSPYRFYYRQLQAKLTRSKRLFVLKDDKDQPDDQVTHDFVMDKLVIHGGVSKVVEEILALREAIGDFGEIVYAGLDWVDSKLAQRSMELMAQEVLPRVNAAIGSSAEAA
jgi:alkanesulfonate monooxygenase SsuD/methylene tetrahydromethanopterin reductase-like flavin-dependent oxidoreductase (luciferase family)